MLLIADSGSTKTTWNMVCDDRTITACTTSGTNPFFLGSDEIVQLLEAEFTLPRKGISSVWFYGAGCALPDKKQILKDALSQFFETDKIEINSDLLAAAHSLCGGNPGIACIMGTGSNSCFYDGREIMKNISPLGFILGDEGSGAVLGRKLLADILKNQASKSICEDFFTTYQVTAGEILENVYRKALPNRYLAQYATFISKHINSPYMATLVNSSFCDFFRRNVMQYPEAIYLPIHFTGSIAFFFREQLEKAATSFGLTIGNISHEPMSGLIEYHLSS